MNKHNIIELHDYRKNKEKVKLEHSCFEILDKVGSKAYELKFYIRNFKEYVELMVKDKNIKKSFADSLLRQVDMIFEASVGNISSNG